MPVAWSSSRLPDCWRGASYSPRRWATRLERGERVGLIKFGSRTDVIFPADAEMKVRVGDHVKGGSTVLAIAQPVPVTPQAA